MSTDAPWPPSPEDVWHVHGTMGAPAGGVSSDGVGIYALLRLAARRNNGAEESDTTYALGLEETASVIGGLISVANAAFGRQALQDAMAAALHMTDEDRRRAAREAAERLQEGL